MPPDALDTIGSIGSTEQGKRKRWQPGGGESITRTHRGPKTAVSALYDAKKLAALNDPSIASIDLDEGRGLAQLQVEEIDPINIIGQSNNNGVLTIYELLYNENQRPVHEAPYFNTLAATEIVKVYDYFDKSRYADPSSSGFAGKQLELLQLLALGTEDYFESAPVVRETKVVTGGNALVAAADLSNVNKVVSLPAGVSSNPLIGDIPAGEWLYKSPAVRRITRLRWEIIKEYWFAPSPGWSTALYNGSRTP